VNPSASKLQLLETCAAAGALPSVWTESTDDQAAGTARHRYLQRAGELGREAALAEVPADASWRNQVLGIDVTELPTGRYEIAYAYDTATDTARELGQWIDRAYEVTATEVSGTADLVAPPTADRPRWLVIDFKGFEEVEAAERNFQLGSYALCVARHEGLDEVDVAIVYVGHSGDLRWDRATLGAFELEAVAARVRAVVARVHAARATLAAGQLPDFSTGLHCKRCPSLPLCPAQTAAVRLLLADPPTPDQLALLSDEDAGLAWTRLAVADAFIDQAKASLRARAELRGLPLPDGQRLMPVLMPSRKIVDLDGMLAILRTKFGAQADALVERSLTFESIAGLVRQVAPGKGQKKTLDALREELEAAKVLKSTSFTQLRVKKAKASNDVGVADEVA